MIQGIGIDTCLYVNPKTHEYWVIDYRIFDRDHDGKTKIDHLLDMLHDAYSNTIFNKYVSLKESGFGDPSYQRTEHEIKS